MNPVGYTTHDLGGGLLFLTGCLPAELVWSDETFQAAWHLHPDERPSIHLHGRRVQIPRWQQAYGADYRFSGQTSRALPVPPLLDPLLAWARGAIHPALNGLLLNWYDGPKHHIGPHRDDVRDVEPGAPIVTVSFGETRTFRLRPWRDSSGLVRDFAAENGVVFLLPQDTNAAWTHAVVKSTRYTGRRISVTIRAFVDV